jgi:hypothetical protein
MGVFFESQLAEPKVRDAIKDALETDPQRVPNTATEAAARASAVTDEIRLGIDVPVGAVPDRSEGLPRGRRGGDRYGRSRSPTSPEALYGLAGTILGLVVGFLGGEKPGT